MKSTFLFLCIWLICHTSSAQYKINMGLGTNMPRVSAINNFLREANAQPLEGLGFISSMQLVLEDGDSRLANHFEFGYFGQSAANYNNNASSLQGFSWSANLGYKFVKKTRHTLEGFLGFASNEFTRLTVLRGNASSNNLATQLIAPTATFTQLTYRARSFIHAGVQYKFHFKNFGIGLRAGNYFRIAKGKWFHIAPNAQIPDAPPINALGNYVAVVIYFY